MKALLIVLMLLPMALAVDCSWPNSVQLLGGDAEGICVVEDYVNAYCQTYLSAGGETWGLRPSPHYVDDVGRIDYFTGEAGIIPVDFDTSRLIPGVNITLNVVCGNETANQQINPVLVETGGIPETIIFIKNNSEVVLTWLLITTGILLLAWLILSIIK